jgi:hypothetical protein
MKVHTAVVRWIQAHDCNFVVATTRDRLEEEVVKVIVPVLKYYVDDEEEIRNSRDFDDLQEWGYDTESFEVITNSQVEIKSDHPLLIEVLNAMETQ